jgi:glucokinase
MLLAGDIGATKTHLAAFSPEGGPHTPLSEATFPSARYPSLEAIVQDFLLQTHLSIEWASFGVAGPVVQGCATITNLPWVIDAVQIREAFHLSSVILLNDLESIATAVPLLQAQDLHSLHLGKAVSGGAIAIIAPGTGLGEAFLTWDGARYRAHATEGGHTDFGPNNDLELEMLRYLKRRFEHVSYELVCSGVGLPNIYAYLRDSRYAEEPGWLAEELAAASDPTPVIVNNALDPQKACKLTSGTLDVFVSVLGAEAGNLALKTLATGGVYLGGGIPPRIVPALENARFLQAFRSKGRLSHVLADIPVQVILNPKVALMGAAWAGLQEIAPHDGKELVL